MRDVLAERLLGQVMEWTPEDIARERPILQALATLKYDEYQLYSPGMRFVESLALWLNQFTAEEKIIMYKFFKERLVFISNSELLHLVSISFQDYIRPMLVDLLAHENNIPRIFLCRILNSEEYKLLVARSLFLGLSDGAHIGIFRRSNPGLSHEQILAAYDISDSKADELREELSKSLSNILNSEPQLEEVKFRTVFLLDDFSASGISYLRKEESKWKGKINKVLDRIAELSNQYKLFDLEELTICIVLYVATEKSLNYLESMFDFWIKEHKSKITFKILVTQIIRDDISLNKKTEEDVVEILKKYHNRKIETSSYGKGDLSEPYLGFDGCGLPVILSHNTPNNSLPILWFSDDKSTGLFPRVSRHS